MLPLLLQSCRLLVLLLQSGHGLLSPLLLQSGQRLPPLQCLHRLLLLLQGCQRLLLQQH
jgi:hypothetical protein